MPEGQSDNQQVEHVSSDVTDREVVDQVTPSCATSKDLWDFGQEHVLQYCIYDTSHRQHPERAVQSTFKGAEIREPVRVLPSVTQSHIRKHAAREPTFNDATPCWTASEVPVGIQTHHRC
jgi:hypothetical protein